MEEPTAALTRTCPGCRRTNPARSEVCGRCGTDLVDVPLDPEPPASRLPFRRPYRSERPTLHGVPLPRPGTPQPPGPAVRPHPAPTPRPRTSVQWGAAVVALLVVGVLVTLIGRLRSGSGRGPAGTAVRVPPPPHHAAAHMAHKPARTHAKTVAHGSGKRHEVAHHPADPPRVADSPPHAGSSGAPRRSTPSPRRALAEGSGPRQENRQEDAPAADSAVQ
jgi:hypothetical protein